MGETMLTAAGKREAIKGYFMMTCKDANCPQKEGCVIPENTCNVVIDAMLKMEKPSSESPTAPSQAATPAAQTPLTHEEREKAIRLCCHPCIYWRGQAWGCVATKSNVLCAEIIDRVGVHLRNDAAATGAAKMNETLECLAVRVGALVGQILEGRAGANELEKITPLIRSFKVAPQERARKLAGERKVDAMLHPHFGGDHEETQEFWDLRRAICDAIRAAEVAKVNEKLEETAKPYDSGGLYRSIDQREVAASIRSHKLPELPSPSPEKERT